jgi:type IV pilus assembly protein PilX
MNAHHHHLPGSGRGQRQRGIVLITGMLLLLLITLVVLAASRSGRLQAVMSSNTRDRDLAFQAAETALLDAELRLTDFHIDYFRRHVARAGLIDRSAASTELQVAGSTVNYWISPSHALSDGTPGYRWFDANGAVDSNKSIASNQAVSGVDQQPRFVIEYLGTATSSVDCTTPRTHYRYRITALAVGASSGSRKEADTRVILQSEYRLCLEDS